MALDQEYYEKALELLQSKGFGRNHADSIATTLALYIPMRFIRANDWALMPLEKRPINTHVAENMQWLERIPELRKPVIYKMPTDLTFTTYGQEYVPGTDSPTYTTGPDGYTHHPVGWESGIVGPTGKSGRAGKTVPSLEFSFKPAVGGEPQVILSDGQSTRQMSLTEFLKMADGSVESTSWERAFINIWRNYNHTANPDIKELLKLHAERKLEFTPESSLNEHITEMRKDNPSPKLGDLSDLDGIKAAYPDISDRDAEIISKAHRTIQRAISPPDEMATGHPHFGSLFDRALSDNLLSEPWRPVDPNGRVKINTQSVRNFGGLHITTPLFGQSHKNPTGPQTMPGLEKGLNGKPQRRKKGKGKRYER